MAIRVQNSDIIVFGIMADASVTATHGRIQKAGQDPVVRPLSANVTAAVGERLRVVANEIDFVYPSNQVGDDHMDAVIRSYWEGEEFQIDLMTDSSTVVADSGYSQQSSRNWGITTEAD